MATGITLGEIMQKAVVTVKPSDNVKKVADTMAKTDIGGVIVTENNQVNGIVTEGDIISKVIAEGKNYDEVKVEEIMNTPVESADEEMDVEEALKLMRDLEIERLPVTEGNELLGIVTERDLTKVEPALIEMAREKTALTKRKHVEQGEVAVTGQCEECGNTSNQLREIHGKLLCPSCEDLER